jgi:hypothetical protein
MIVFVSGTQGGGTMRQLATLRTLLSARGISRLVTGGCTGVDEEAVRIMVEVRSLPRWGHIITFPASDVAEHKKSKYVLEQTHELHAPMPALSRNGAASMTADLCIFVPKETAEVTRSGTWSAYRGAGKQRRMRLVISPDGSIGL